MMSILALTEKISSRMQNQANVQVDKHGVIVAASG